MSQEIRPVPQRVGRGSDPDKIMVANRKVGSGKEDHGQVPASAASTQSVRDGIGGLAEPQDRPVVVDAQLAWKQRRATGMMRRALSSKGVLRSTMLEELPNMISNLAEQKDPSKDGSLTTRLVMRMGRRKRKDGRRKGLIPFPKDWEEVRQQMQEELRAGGRNEEADKLGAVDEEHLYKLYTDPKAKDVVIATLLAMDEDKAAEMRDSLDRIGLKP